MIRVGQPLFLIQIVRVADGAVAQIPGGGPLEANFIDLCTAHIMSKGVSFKTSKHVKQDIHDGIKAAIMSMKEQTTHIA